MKSLVFLLGFLFSCAAAEPNRAYIENPYNVYHLQHSTVALMNKNSSTQNLEGPFCTAFFINSTTLISAHHCLEIVEMIEIEISPGNSIKIEINSNASILGTKKIFVTKRDHDNALLGGTNLIYHEATVIAESKENDLALLKVVDEYKSEYWLSITNNKPSVGQVVYGMGMPSGQPWVLTQGIVTSFRKVRKQIVHQAHVSPGASGSPLIDNRGRLVGINVAFIGISYLGVAVSVEALYDLLKHI